jgi:protein SCO1
VNRRALLRATGAAVAAATLAGCDFFALPKSPFHGVDITGGDFAKDFRLTDPGGRERTLADFRGKAVALFFGYTNCPDFCPTTLHDLAEARKRLGADAARLQVLFVTVDPKRDTPALLASYVPAFDPTFLGLYGDESQVARTAKDFRVYAQVHEGTKPGSYTVDHSAQVLVFDPTGRLRLLWPYGTSSAFMADDLRVLLNN